MSDRLLFSASVLLLIFGLEGVFPHFKGRHHRIRHGFPNVVLGSLNGVITGLIFGGLTVMVAIYTESNNFGLLHIISIPSYVRGIAAFALFDLWMYLWHRANHRIHFLWRFHRVHHTDREMDATTALRFHPLEIVFSSTLRLIVIPVLGINLAQLLIYEMCLQLIILFHHSNIRLPERWDRRFRSIIVTPNMHRVHHSEKGSEFNSNYSSGFSFWDRLFGTFRERDDTLKISFGLNVLQGQKWQSLWGMLRTPMN